MTLADIAFWTLIIIGFGLCFLAYWLAAVALCPRLVADCGERLSRRPVIATVTGLGILLPTLALSLALSQHLHGPGGFVSIVLLSTVGLLALLGSAGLARLVGAGLAPPVQGADAQQPWAATVRGCCILLGTFLAPFLGWFVVMPVVLISGLGAAALTLLARRRAGSPPAAISVSAMPAGVP